jgi:hypothetical protein
VFRRHRRVMLLPIVVLIAVAVVVARGLGHL